MTIGPVIDAIVGPYLIKGILVALNIPVEIQELSHSVDLGMQLVVAVLLIHAERELGFAEGGKKIG